MVPSSSDVTRAMREQPKLLSSLAEKSIGGKCAEKSFDIDWLSKDVLQDRCFLHLQPYFVPLGLSGVALVLIWLFVILPFTRFTEFKNRRTAAVIMIAKSTIAVYVFVIIFSTVLCAVLYTTTTWNDYILCNNNRFFWFHYMSLCVAK